MPTTSIVRLEATWEGADALRGNKQLRDDLDRTKTTVSGVAGSFGEMGKAIRAVFAAAIIQRVGRFVLAMERLESSTAAAGRGLRSLAATQGVDPVRLLNQIEEASAGTLTRLQATTLATGALATRLPILSDNIGDIISSIRTVSTALGRDAVQDINRFFEAAAKGEPELLDELRVVVRMNEANKRFADRLGLNATQLTDYQRRLAFASAAVEKLTGTADALGTVVDRQADSTARAGVAWDNFKLALAGLVDTGGFLDNIAFFLTDFAESLDALPGQIEAIKSALTPGAGRGLVTTGQNRAFGQEPTGGPRVPIALEEILRLFPEAAGDLAEANRLFSAALTRGASVAEIRAGRAPQRPTERIGANFDQRPELQTPFLDLQTILDLFVDIGQSANDAVAGGVNEYLAKQEELRREFEALGPVVEDFVFDLSLIPPPVRDAALAGSELRQGLAATLSATDSLSFSLEGVNDNFAGAIRVLGDMQAAALQLSQIQGGLTLTNLATGFSALVPILVDVVNVLGGGNDSNDEWFRLQLQVRDTIDRLRGELDGMTRGELAQATLAISELRDRAGSFTTIGDELLGFSNSLSSLTGQLVLDEQLEEILDLFQRFSQLPRGAFDTSTFEGALQEFQRLASLSDRTGLEFRDLIVDLFGRFATFDFSGRDFQPFVDLTGEQFRTLEQLVNDRRVEIIEEEGQRLVQRLTDAQRRQIANLVSVQELAFRTDFQRAFAAAQGNIPLQIQLLQQAEGTIADIRRSQESLEREAERVGGLGGPQAAADAAAVAQPAQVVVEGQTVLEPSELFTVGESHIPIVTLFFAIADDLQRLVDRLYENPILINMRRLFEFVVPQPANAPEQLLLDPIRLVPQDLVRLPQAEDFRRYYTERLETPVFNELGGTLADVVSGTAFQRLQLPVTDLVDITGSADLFRPQLETAIDDAVRDLILAPVRVPIELDVSAAFSSPEDLDQLVADAVNRGITDGKITGLREGLVGFGG